jgi:hypothetical protein
MGTSILHNDIKKIEKLLVNAVHLVKSPANRKHFFMVKGEQMTKEELGKKLKEQGLTEDEIKFTLENKAIVDILLDSKNEKKALDVIKDGIKNSFTDIDKVLNDADSISSLSEKLVGPLEKLTTFLSNGKEDGKDNKDTKVDGKDTNDNSDSSDKEFENSVSELASEISGLAQDTVALVEDTIN